ncbi:MAG: hypothetical protein BVN28_06585 [Nitrospira sp. ST-bin4]|nr:MAG: hypothetical protein BVN28_06585 [Nitrospira sp. ST-bin4]
MSLTVGKYTFSAWLRKGIGRSIIQTDTLGASGGTVKERATVPVDVSVNTRPVHKEFKLMGPGDVTGISNSNVVRTEPKDWVTDFEPNYLAFVEFYDEDLPWRYTPAAPAGARLRPWLALVVLEEDTDETPGEFTIERRMPLPVLKVSSSASLPPATQTWAWAHVHTNETFADASQFERFLESLQQPDHPNSDRIISRLTSPRKLKPNTPYGAFVVPAFETGRLAGLGQNPKDVDAQLPAWSGAPGAVELPVFFQWRFRTGENEDFESMVKRLEPKVADSHLGIRNMDGEKPGWGLTVGTNIGQVVPADEKQTVLGLEGALKAPTTRPRPSNVDPTRQFLQELQSVLNFPEQRRSNPATAPLPVVSPPIYGEHHARKHTVDVTRSGWVDALNRDPRNRVSAGFGTRVVQENQENYVARAWKQVQKVLEANRLIRLAAYAMRASEAVYVNLGAKFSTERKLAFFGGTLRKIRGSPTTLQHLVNQSTLPAAALSGALRRFLRPRGAFARRITRADGGFTHEALIKDMADGVLTAAPPKKPGSDLVTDDSVVKELPPAVPGWLQWLLRHRWLLFITLIVLLLLVGLFTGAWVLVIGLAMVALITASVWASNHPPQPGPGAPGGPGGIIDPGTVVDVLNQVSPRSDFGFVEINPVVPPRGGGATQVTTATETTSANPGAIGFTTVTTFTPGGSGRDSAQAEAFRLAATRLEQRLTIRAAEPVRENFDLDNAGIKLSAALNPLTAFPKFVTAGVKFDFAPTWLLEPEHLVPAMAYPDFDDPMYEKLRDLSSELLLPNLKLLPPNSITLLETNPPFIEAYLAGLNTEFGKELLWREYPTDQRGSYFRKFWDTRGILATPTGESASATSEKSKDITPLDSWTSTSALGSHRNPQRPPGEQVVLTIRGDLLKKYPNTLIYAQKAHLARDSNGNPQPQREPVIANVENQADIDREIKFPVFKASVDPDIRFFGFDLTAEQAKGAANPQTDNDDWGYYFIIQQLPGEPRFGMDIAFEPDDNSTTPLTWNDLAWDRFPAGQMFVDTSVQPQNFVPAGAGESLAQWGSDSARMANILLQAPVMIAMHAKEMLEGL